LFDKAIDVFFVRCADELFIYIPQSFAFLPFLYIFFTECLEPLNFFTIFWAFLYKDFTNLTR